MALAASVGSSVLPGVLVLSGLNEVAPAGVSMVPAAVGGWEGGGGGVEWAPAGVSMVPAAVAGCEAVADDFACAPVPPLAVLLSGLRKPTAHTVAAIAGGTGHSA